MSILVNCENCGIEIKITPSRFKARSNFFCSKKCEAEYKTAELNVVCKSCGKRFHVKPLRLKKLKNKENICCSKLCSNKFREITFLGENNHQFGLKGELNDSFKSDIVMSVYGYILTRNMTHPFRTKGNFVFFHRLVMENYLKTNEPDSDNLVDVNGELFLSPDILVHHMNENKLDNRLENLMCLNLSEHVTLHNKKMGLDRDESGRFMQRGRVKYLSDKAKLFRKHADDAGQDVSSNETVVIPTRSSALISTGLIVEIPKDHVGLLWSRSGLSVRNRIEVGAGCIDESYRGEIKVHLYNHSNADFKVERGDRIAQLLTMPINLVSYKEIGIQEELDITDRGENGFGSTGVN